MILTIGVLRHAPRRAFDRFCRVRGSAYGSVNWFVRTGIRVDFDTDCHGSRTSSPFPALIYSGDCKEPKRKKKKRMGCIYKN